MMQSIESLPVVIAESTKELDAAFEKLDEAGGSWIYCYVEKKLICIQYKTFI